MKHNNFNGMWKADFCQTLPVFVTEGLNLDYFKSILRDVEISENLLKIIIFIYISKKKLSAQNFSM